MGSQHLSPNVNLVHHNAATQNAAMHNASFSQRYPYPFFTASIAVMPFPVFSIARSNFLHRTHRPSAFASIFPFATMVYCTKQQEICQESQRSDVATGNARWPSQTQTQTQRLRCTKNVKNPLRIRAVNWLEILTSRDAKSTCFKAPGRHVQKSFLYIFWPKFGRKIPHHVMDASR